MQDVMLDLETFGTKAGCVIRSIGMAFFDPNGSSIGETFYRNLREEEQIAAGCHKDEQTIAWWARQGEEAQRQLLEDQMPFEEVAESLCFFFKKNKGKRVWAQGANFDTILLEHNLSLFGFKAPWLFYNVRDTRTVYEMARFDTKSIFRRGTYHNALDDAKHQIRCVQESHRKVTVNGM